MSGQYHEEDTEALWRAIEDIRREMFGHDGTNGIRGRLIRIETNLGALRTMITLAIPVAAILTGVAVRVIGG